MLNKINAWFHHKTNRPFALKDFSSLIVGKKTKFLCLDGKRRTIIDFDYTATKPILSPVVDALNRTYEWRQNAHRAPSPKSQVTTENYEKAREVARKFMGAEHLAYEAAFQPNTTYALNMLSTLLKSHFAGAKRDTVLISVMSHHSNMLPWRERWSTRYIDVNKNGTIDMEQYAALLKEVGDKVALVTTETVSNVTGFINPVVEMARLAHQSGALISVDNAQGAASLPFKIYSGEMESSIDFATLSGHKIYGPEGTGVLVGKKEYLQGDPPFPGGGTVRGVTRDVRYYEKFPANVEAGSQNHAGQIGMAVAMKVLMQIGLENIQTEELQKAEYAVNKMGETAGVQILGERDFSNAKRLGIIAFNLYDSFGKPIRSALVGAMLAFQYAIGIRTGCFCAGPYMETLQGLSEEEAQKYAALVNTRDDKLVPYFCRASFSIDKSYADIDYLINALKEIRVNYDEWWGKYYFDLQQGMYLPKNAKPDFPDLLKI